MAAMASGKVYVFEDSSRLLTKTFDGLYHPKDWAARLAYGATATQLFPAAARWRTPDATPGVAPPWSLMDFFGTCAGQRLACLLGTFQTALTGGTTTYDACYITPETLANNSPTRPAKEGWDALYHWERIGVLYAAQETIG